MKRFQRATLLGTLMLALSPCDPAAKADFSYTTIDVSGSVATVAQGINNAGQVVGYYVDSTGVEHGFLRSVDGTSYKTIDPAGARFTEVTGINDAGQIVGYANIAGQDGYQGFIQAANGSFSLFSYPATSSTLVEGINNLGQVSGFTQSGFRETGFIRSADGTTTTLNYSRAFGINDSGQTLVGYVGTATTLRNADGSITNLPEGLAYFGINNLGSIAGFGPVGANGMVSALVLEADLKSDTVLNPTGATSSVAYGLNDTGQVVGSYHDLTGKTVGFLATPAVVPEPASLAMLSVGLVAIAGLLRSIRFGTA